MKTKTYCFSADFSPRLKDEFYKTGIPPYPQNGMVPLAKTEVDATALFLCLVKLVGDPLPRSVYVYHIELPEKTALKKMGFAGLEPRVYYGHKGIIPPEYIKGQAIVDLDPLDSTDKTTMLQTRQYYYPAREADASKIDKSGIRGKKIVLAETPEDAAVLGATKFKTKENGIKTIALVFVDIPVNATLERGAVKVVTGDEIDAVELSGPIPASWINEINFIDFREGGLFA